MRRNRDDRNTERKGQFTPRDQQIVVSVHEARYLLTDHVLRLYFGSPSRCRTRMGFLIDKGYLKKRVPKFPNSPDIYYLGLMGRRFLSRAFGLDIDWLEKVAGTGGDGVSALMMRHEMTLSNLYVDATLECRRQEWKMEWRNTRMLELLNLGVQPDAYVKVSKGETEMEALIEFTDALTDLPEIRKKIQRYEALFRNRPVVVLWFTASLSKAKTIRRLCNESAYKSWFLVGLEAESTDFLTKQMWMWSESEERVQFVKPSEVVLLSRR